MTQNDLPRGWLKKITDCTLVDIVTKQDHLCRKNNRLQTGVEYHQLANSSIFKYSMYAFYVVTYSMLHPSATLALYLQHRWQYRSPSQPAQRSVASLLQMQHHGRSSSSASRSSSFRQRLVFKMKTHIHLIPLKRSAPNTHHIDNMPSLNTMLLVKAEYS